MTLHIDDPDIDRLARELANRTGETVAEAVKTAVRQRLEALPSATPKRIDWGTINAILAEIDELPSIPAPLSDDEALGYDQLYGFRE